MNCKKCGNIVTENDKFCPSCGQAIEVASAPVTETQVTETPAPAASEPAPVTPTPIITEPIVNQMPNNVNTTNKKGNGAFIVLVIVLGLIIIGLGVFIAIKMLGDKDSGTNETANNNSSSEVVNNNTDNSNNNTVEPSTSTTPTQTTTTSGNTITLGDYVLTLPAGIEQVGNGNVYGNDEFVFALESQYVSYSRLSEALPSLRDAMTERGITIKSEKEYTFGARKYYIMEVYNVELGATEDLFFTELDSYSVAIGELYMDSITREKAYGYLNEIFASKKTSGASNFAGTTEEEFKPFDIDFITTEKNN